jgi:DNA mismatch endonuclease, patch repair protein
MARIRSTPTFAGLEPASLKARHAAQAASKKSGTRCELVLRRSLWAMGLRYRRSSSGLAGNPDLVFPREKVAVFCDGDFWHGRDLDARLARLSQGHNAPYWVEKIRTNVRRDYEVVQRLSIDGWNVVRLWETDILRDSAGAAGVVAALLEEVRKALPMTSASRHSEERRSKPENPTPETSVTAEGRNDDGIGNMDSGLPPALLDGSCHSVNAATAPPDDSSAQGATR